MRRLRRLVVLAASLVIPAAHAQTIPVDAWALDRTGLRAAWSVSTGRGVTIAIVDSGVDLGQPMLSGRLVGGRDFVDGDDTPQDGNGHGTHVAGIAAAGAPDARIMPVRVLDADGSGDDATIADAIRWAVDAGATVVNLSLGEEGIGIRLGRGGALNDAMRDVGDRAVVVASAGNEGARARKYRILVPVVVVGAIDARDEPAPFSNFGDLRAVVAPGVDIRSTAPLAPTAGFPDGTDGTAVLSGTSMAAPFVSAEAALLMAQGRRPDDVRRLIERTAERPHLDRRYGEGVIDADAAVRSSGAVMATPKVTEHARRTSAPSVSGPPRAAPPTSPVSGTSDPVGPAILIAVVVGAYALAAVLWWRRRGALR